MKLLYVGAPACDIPTLKRLVVVGEDICFTDRPSVTFGNRGEFGTVGLASPMRQLNTTGEPVTVRVYEPPSGPARALYQPLLEADLGNPEFIDCVLDGLRNSDAFATKLLQLNADYGYGKTGAQIRDAVVRAGRPTAPFDLRQSGDMFDIDTSEGLHETLKMLLIECSIDATVALVVAQQADAYPIADDPYMARLIGLRTSTESYKTGPGMTAPLLGLEFTKSVLPDELLQQLSFPDIMAYRRKAKEPYDAWNAELNRVAAELDDLSAATPDRIQRLIASDLTPKVTEYRSEMQTIRDSLFGGLVKSITHWEVPSLLIAHVSGQDIATGLATFAAAALAGAARPVVDYMLGIRRVNRSHAVSYLLGLAKT